MGDFRFYRNIFLQIECALMLLRAGIDYMIRDHEGLTAFDLAALESSPPQKADEVCMGRGATGKERARTLENAGWIGSSAHSAEARLRFNLETAALNHRERNEDACDMNEKPTQRAPDDRGVREAIGNEEQLELLTWGSNINYTLGHADGSKRSRPQRVVRGNRKEKISRSKFLIGLYIAYF